MTGTKFASEIPVKELHQTFIWPLVITDPEKHPDWRRDVLQEMKDGDWEVDELTKSGTNDPGFYSEAVYFHEFVRKFLYPKNGWQDLGPEPAMISLSRTKPFDWLEAKIEHPGIGPLIHKFRMLHCSIRLFQFGAAVLVLELEHQSIATPNHEALTLMLSHAQTVIDHLRRAYAPYWVDETPGGSPLSIKLGRDGEACPEPFDLGELATAAKATDAMFISGSELVFPWWDAIMSPLRFAGCTDGADKPCFRQVLDERIPVLTTISLTRGGGSAEDLEQVSPGDWDRIGAADAAGTNKYPYNPRFIAAEKPVHKYDRFAPHADTDRGGATCFLMCHYHFAAVGAGWFFDTHVVNHMRRQYRQMMLIAYLEFAALLMFSSRLTALASDLKAKDGVDDGLRDRLVAINQEFFQFTHIYRFTGVSNQVQARELFDRMRRSIGLNELFADVKQEMDGALQFSLANESRRRAETAETLTEVATIGLAVGLGATFAPMAGAMPWADGLGSWDWLPLSFAIAGVIAAVTMGLLGVGRKKISRRLGLGLKALMILGLLSGAVLAASAAGAFGVEKEVINRADDASG